MQLAWRVVRHALELITLRDIGRRLARFVAHVTRANGRRHGERQRERLAIVQQLAPP
jgi:hypothetical protein